MPSTRQFKKVAKKEPTGSVGIAVHTSEPLYGKNKPNSNEHEHHLPPVEALAVNNNGYQPAQAGQGYYDPDSHHHNYDHTQGHQAEAHQHSYHQAQNIYSPQQSAHTHDHHPSHDHAHVHHDHGHVHQDHHDHAHAHHDHSHHDHAHHDHAHHDHAHHNHAHHHNFPPVYTPPLPSWVQIFSTLIPEQKTIFTWFMIHLGIGFWLYCLGTSRECLSLVGFAYLMIFDALGVLNTFVSSILRTQPAFTTSNTKRPYGAHRYEIVFALGTTIYLLFATMNNTKESLEHFLLQDQHHLGEPHHDEVSANTFSFGVFLLIGAAISATCLSTISLRNHESFVRYLRKRPTTVQGFTYNVVNRARASPLSALSSNIYSLSIVLCGITILVCYPFGFLTPFIDKAVALSESCVMFYLGYPTASALAKVLLQTTPRSIQNGVENRLREIQQQEVNIISMDRIHFWQTTYGKCVGTIEVRVQPEADEQAILELIYQKLEGLTNNTADSSQSELTVSIIKH